MFNSFELSDEDKAKTDMIFDKITKYLEPKSNFRIARFQVQGFRQTKDESVDSFMLGASYKLRNANSVKPSWKNV